MLAGKTINAGSATNYRAYTYDNLYRLKTETLNNSTVNSWEYDDLGNITSKTSVVKTGDGSVIDDCFLCVIVLLGNKNATTSKRKKS